MTKHRRRIVKSLTCAVDVSDIASSRETSVSSRNDSSLLANVAPPERWHVIRKMLFVRAIEERSF